MSPVPEKFRLMLARFSRGCEMCGVMQWRATKSGEMACGNCGNVFDMPLMDERDEPPVPPSPISAGDGND